MFRILCLDGGGSRGYFTASIIENIEKRYNIKVNEYFDLIVGTSTGAIIAGAIAVDVDAKDITRMYLEEYKNVFKSSILKGIFSSKYESDKLRVLLENNYKNKDFKDAKTNLLITATDILSSEPQIFKSWDPKGVRLIDAVMASASAPIYFEPHKIKGKKYIDGCIWSNNPSLVALVEAISKKGFAKKMSDIKILSIGTGKNSEELKNEKSGLISWSKDIVPLSLKTNVEAVNILTENLLEKNFLRIDFYCNDKISINNIPEYILTNSDKIFDEFTGSLDIFFKNQSIFTRFISKIFNYGRKK